MTVPAPLARLSEGFCPISTHGRLTSTTGLPAARADIWDLNERPGMHCHVCDVEWGHYVQTCRTWAFKPRPVGDWGPTGHGVDDELLHIVRDTDTLLLDIVAFIGGTPRT